MTFKGRVYVLKDKGLCQGSCIHSGRDPRPNRGKPLSDQIRARAVAFPRPALFLQPPAQPLGDNDDDPGRSTASKDLKNIDEDTYGGNSSG
ncbi:hypothetical protein CC2G_002367 [Coprinopsis cinerea AmutBmut pab1-1]|nr:hypothetical protein CC2G_002367 [Coprinopsis cinerea AmutBmut pab1-1]